MYTTYKKAIGIAATGLLTITASTASAATINFEIDFFDEIGDQVGSGSFSYDDDGEELTCFFTSTVCVPGLEPDERTEIAISIIGLEPPDSDPEFSSAYEIYSNLLTDFSADIYGVNYDGLPYRWWADEESGQQPGQIIFSRDGGFAGSSWQLGFSDNVSGVNLSNMFFDDQASETFATGTWDQSISPVIDPPSTLPLEPGETTFNAEGTFEARRVETPQQPNPTSVPEPSSMFGTLIAMLLGYRVKRNLARAKQ